MTTKQASKRKRGRQLRSTGIVSLRRYLESNLRQMEMLIANWKGGKDGKRYWKNGASKIKAHLKTVKAIEREAQANGEFRRTDPPLKP